MNGLKRSLANARRTALVTVALALLVAAPARASVIEMVMLFDGSGSVGLDNFQTQMQAYQAEFQNSFYSRNLKPGDTLHVTAYQFALDMELEVGWTTIDSDASAAAFGAQLGAIEWNAGWTNTALAIETALGEFDASTRSADRQVMHMVTDGNPCLPDALGGCPQSVNQYRADILQRGIVASALAVGPGLERRFIEGAFQNVDGVPDFTDIPATLGPVMRRDLFIPASAPVPEPGALSLMAASLVGALALRRRRPSGGRGTRVACRAD